MSIDVMTLVWVMVAFLLLALVVLTFYLVGLIAEARKTIKITNSIAAKVDDEIAPILKSAKEISQVAEDVSIDIERKYKSVSGLVNTLGIALDAVNQNKVGVLKRILPSQKTLDTALAGIKRGVEVFFSSKKESKKHTPKRGE